MKSEHDNGPVASTGVDAIAAIQVSCTPAGVTALTVRPLCSVLPAVLTVDDRIIRSYSFGNITASFIKL